MVLEMYLPLLASKEEESKFEQIYYENRNLLYYCAYSILGDVQLSEDAVSEAFLALIKNMDKIAGNDTERTRSYLVIIVRNAARRICRSRKHEVVTAPQDLPDLTSIQMDIHAREAKADLFRLVQSLDEKYADVLVLKYYHQLRDREIARSLGVSLTAVKSRLARGKRLLAEKIKEEMP